MAVELHARGKHGSQAAAGLQNLWEQLPQRQEGEGLKIDHGSALTAHGMHHDVHT